MISVQGIRKHYGPVKALDGVSFEVPAGQILGFLGPNGAGKSTMMKILTCFITPTEGSAEVAGHDVLSASMDVRRSVGYLPESCPLYEDMTVYEYLEYVANARGIGPGELVERIRSTLQVCGLTGRVDQLIGTLSKGFRQRVGLAQAMIHEPDVLVLDEPTSGLDPNQIVEIREVIKRIGREKTVILSTHILSEVQATCDRVLIVNEGRLVADGTPEELAGQLGSNSLSVEVQHSGKDDGSVNRGLKSIPGVRMVKRLPAVTGDTKSLRYRVELDSSLDLRAQVFQKAVDEGWVLLELHRAESNLEEVFRSLTIGN